jgi:DNA-binding SARP family transcriptional activator
MTVRLKVLGAPSCFHDDRELVELPAQKTRFALLVYLASQRSVSRDSVAALFWPDSDDERARHTLSQALYELKRALSDSWLETQGGRLIVNAQVEIESEIFTSALHAKDLEKALAVYRGPFLDGFYLPNNQQFDSWLARERAQFERAHRKARRELLDGFLNANDFGAAIEAARSWVEVDPLEDEANHRLIELLIRTGARAEALNVFTTYERLVKEELDVVPLEHTRELIQSLRDGTLTLARFEPLAVADAQTPTALPAAVLRRPRLTRAVALAVTAALPALLVLTWLAARGVSAWPLNGPAVPVDTSRFVIFPFEHDDSIGGVNEETLLREAFARWTGIVLVDEFQTQEAFERLPAPANSRRLLRLARELGAGRFVRGHVSRLGDSLLIHTALYDVANRGRVLIARDVRVPVRLSNADAIFAQLAEGLLFRSDAATKAMDPPTTRSWPAREAFRRAQGAIRQWDLQRADVELAAATQLDPDYTEAFLWLAQIRSWLRYDVAQWSFAAEHAFDDRARLSLRDQGLAAALIAVSQKDLARACAQYRGLTKASSRDFAVWYGLADCLQRDELVEADTSTSSGWRFRSSYHSAVQAYQRAFELLPSVHMALRADNFRVVRRLLKTQRTALRTGSASGSGPYEFAAYPELEGDTLVFVPYPASDFNVKPRDVRLVNAAVAYQRRIFSEIASSWLAAYPASAHAREAVALALELLGDPSALDTLVSARSVAREERDRVRLTTNEVLLRLKYSLPHDLKGVRRARMLADSILRTQNPQTTAHPALMAALAVLTGRSDRALAFMRTNQAAEGVQAPAVLRPALMPLFVFAAVGGPRDSLAFYEDRLGDLIDAALPGEERDRARNEWLLRSAYMSLPLYRFQHLGSIGANDTLMMAAALAGSPQRFRVKGLLQPLRYARRDIPPSSLTIDVLYPETWVLYAAGQDSLAAEWIDPLLENMHAWPPFDRAGELMEIGGWVRAMALRAEIADRMRDRRTARLWARAVLVLWSDADKSLRPTTRRMAELAN